MAEPRPTDELKVLRDLLARMEDGRLKMVSSGKDVTSKEVGILKREIAFLEKIIARLKDETRG
jgi:dihydroorotase